MPYPGYLSLGGVEIANSARVLTYARDIAPDFNLTGCDDCPDLAAALGDGEYRSPLLDQPDWFDENDPDTWNIAGFYPLSVTGLTDSTRTASVTDSLQDGGVVGRTRHRPREVRVSGLLIAADTCALDKAFEWLKRALDGNQCDTCAGNDLCFLSCCPEVPPGGIDPNADPVTRPVPLDIGWKEDSGTWINGRFRPTTTPAAATGPELDPPCDDVTYTWTLAPRAGAVAQLGLITEDGSLVGDTGPIPLDAGGVYTTTAPNGSGPVVPTLIVLAGDEVTILSLTVTTREPTDPTACLDEYLRTLREVTTLDGPTIVDHIDTSCGAVAYRVEFILVAAVPWVYQVLDPTYEVIDGDLGPITVPANDCPAEEDESLLPINDPQCPLPPAPPRPPRPDDCLETVVSYVRRAVAIPGDLLAPWAEAVPVVDLQVRTGTPVRQARVRFYPNPLDRDRLIDLEPCAFCGEFVVSYIPPNATLTIDGMTERATVALPGDVVRDATHLLYGTDGGPMTWPLLACGLSYVMTVDTAPTSTDVLATSLQLVVRS